jgi:hypothetical protein
LKRCKKRGKSCPDFEDDPKFKITRGENDWKFEFSITQKKFKFIRAKVYGKTADGLTSCGVK